MILTGLRLFQVRALRLFRCIQFRALRALYPVLLQVLWRFAALLLSCFATIQVLVLLEGQQVGLLLLQLSLELLGLALLLKFSPFILLSAGRVKLNQNLLKPRKTSGKLYRFHNTVFLSLGVYLDDPTATIIPSRIPKHSYSQEIQTPKFP